MLSNIPSFLDGLHRTLQRPAKVMWVDNVYAPGSSTPLTRTDAEGNTYQTRTLDDGSSYEVLKNFPTEKALQEMVPRTAVKVRCEFWQYYWLLEYELK